MLVVVCTSRVTAGTPAPLFGSVTSVSGVWPCKASLVTLQGPARALPSVVLMCLTASLAWLWVMLSWRSRTDVLHGVSCAVLRWSTALDRLV